MRWESLFDDLEAQSAELDRAERSGEIDERTRAEIGRLARRDRYAAAIGLPLRLRLLGAATVSGRLERAGSDWLLLAEEGEREALVPDAAVLGVRGLARFAVAADSGGIVASRLTLRHALRAIARDRSVVRVQLVDGSTVDGTVDRVGSDFVEVAAHAAGEVRRRHEVRDTELVPLPAIVVVRRAR